MEANKMREAFEAWVLREYPNQAMGRFSDGEYHSTTVQYCWLAWQASHEAVAVEIDQLKEENETIRSEAKRQEDGLKEMLRRQNKRICALEGKR